MSTELVGAPGRMRRGRREPPGTSRANQLGSFAVRCQALFGKPADVLVSSNVMRVLFSLRRIVSKPNDSLFTQSRPTQRLPWMIASSAVTTSFAPGVSFGVAAFEETFGLLPIEGGSTRSPANEPLRIENAPAWTTG